MGAVLPSFSRQKLHQAVRRDDIDTAYERAQQYGIDKEIVDKAVDDRLRQRMAYSTLDAVDFGAENGYSRDRMREEAAGVVELILEDPDGSARRNAAELCRDYGIDPDGLEADADLPTWMYDSSTEQLAEAVARSDGPEQLDHHERSRYWSFVDPEEAVAAVDQYIAEQYSDAAQTDVTEWAEEPPSRDLRERVGVEWFTEDPGTVLDDCWD